MYELERPTRVVARTVRGASADADERFLRIVRCEVDGASYALEMQSVAAVLGARGVRPPEVEGDAATLSYHGRTIPVFDFLECQGAAAPHSGRAVRKFVVVVEADGDAWGVLVDRVSQAIRLPESRTAAVPEPIASPALKRILLPPDDQVLSAPPTLLFIPEQLHPERSKPAEWVDPLLGEVSYSPPPLRGGAPRASSKSGGRKLAMFSLERIPGCIGALAASQVQEILLPQPVAPAVLASPLLVGFIAWRKRAVPVLDLVRGLAGGEPSPLEVGGRGRLVVARVAALGMDVAFPVGGDVRVAAAPSEAEPLGVDRPPVDERFVRGLFRTQDAVLAVPDLAALLTWRPAR